MTKLLKKISFILSDFIVLMNLRICVKWTQPQVICLYVGGHGIYHNLVVLLIIGYG